MTQLKLEKKNSLVLTAINFNHKISKHLTHMI